VLACADGFTPSGIDSIGVVFICFWIQSTGVNMFNRLGLVAVCLTLLLILVGCGSSPPVHRGLGSSEAPDVPSRISQGQADDITIYAVGLVGTPYRYGGNTPDSGFDCSGLIGYIYHKRAGLAPPRTVARMQHWGQPVLSDNIRSGDLVLFAQSDVVTHAGIYVGAGRFVHAPSTGGEVRLDQLNSRYWSSQQVTFRRP
jgi:cell wall-associated NlpC family hydrolase